MRKEITAYIASVRNSLSGGEINEKFLSMLLTRIKFYQHERLVHLIVTMTFAVMTVVSFFMITASTLCLVLALLFLGLTIPYVIHYYFLENSVQALYKMYYEAVTRVNG